MSKKFVVWTALITVAVLFLIFFSFSWTMQRQDLVVRGLAKPFFPYFKYSQDELNKLYPQYIENNASTVQSPEETHNKFVEALKKKDFNLAVECCFTKGDQESMKNGLMKINESGELSQMIGDLDQEIKKESMDSWKASYTYVVEKDGKKFGSSIDFIKNSQGVWLIDSL